MVKLCCLNQTELESVMRNVEINNPFCVDVDYILFVDEMPIVLYKVILQKYNGIAKGVWCAEVQYENIFARDDTSKEDRKKYLRKGYVKAGLELLTSELMNYPVPFIHLDISPNNIGSIRVAEGCGYQKNGNSYYKYHSSVLDLLYYSLENHFTEEQKSIIVERFNGGHEQNLDIHKKTY